MRDKEAVTSLISAGADMNDVDEVRQRVCSVSLYHQAR